MAREVINVGTTSDDGTGEPLRTGGIKINNNFEELYLVNAAQQTAIDTNAADITAIETVNATQQTAIDTNAADITAIETVNATQQTVIDSLITANLERGYLNFVAEVASFVLVGKNVSKISNIRVSLMGNEFTAQSLILLGDRLTVNFKEPLLTISDENIYGIEFVSADTPGVWSILKNEFGIPLTFNLYYNRSDFNIDYSLNRDVLKFNLLKDAGAFIDNSWELLLVENKKYVLKIDTSSVLNALLLNPSVKFYDGGLFNTGKSFFAGQDYILVKTVVDGSVVYDLKGFCKFRGDFLPFHVLSNSLNKNNFLSASGISDYLTTNGRLSVVYDSVAAIINKSYARGVGLSVLEFVCLSKVRFTLGYLRFSVVSASMKIRLLIWANKVDDGIGVNSSQNGFVILDEFFSLTAVVGETRQFARELFFSPVCVPSGYYISYVISQVGFYGAMYNGRIVLK